MTLSTPSQKHPEASQATSASQHVEPTGEDPQGVSVAIASLGLAQSRAEARANGARSPRVATTTARARARVEAERPAAIARNAPPPRRVANSSRVDMTAPKTPAMRPRGGCSARSWNVPTSGCDDLVPESRAFQKPDASPRAPRATRARRSSSRSSVSWFENRNRDPGGRSSGEAKHRRGASEDPTLPLRGEKKRSIASRVPGDFLKIRRAGVSPGRAAGGSQIRAARCRGRVFREPLVGGRLGTRRARSDDESQRPKRAGGVGAAQVRGGGEANTRDLFADAETDTSRAVPPAISRPTAR